ncbi:hypothetical protein AAFF_G00398540 [Aldrovandia affinis]|uniref:Uncharacterized protein n=1 Tax=Aldrovandia affinis TaxID=143900 RepID=A0AAD7SCM7_9TELE|nr:hypothetical protein AAFF_G00398540 [Aldrovandia affinis]
MELQQKGERLEAKVLELAQKWKSEGHCGEPGSPQCDPIDDMAWDMEGLPWPGLTVQFDPIDVIIQNVGLLLVSKCPRMESSQGQDNGPPVDIVADEALSPGKAYRSDSQMVSKDWHVITEGRRRRAVKHGQTPEVLGSIVAGKRQRHKIRPKAEATMSELVEGAFAIKGALHKTGVFVKMTIFQKVSTITGSWRRTNWCKRLNRRMAAQWFPKESRSPGKARKIGGKTGGLRKNWTGKKGTDVEVEGRRRRNGKGGEQWV